jgi:ATP-dependent RNA helicase DHX37/DHR1
MDEIHKLRAQISNIVQTYFPGLDAGFMPNLRPPSDLQVMITMILYVNTTYPLH